MRRFTYRVCAVAASAVVLLGAQVSAASAAPTGGASDVEVQVSLTKKIARHDTATYLPTGAPGQPAAQAVSCDLDMDGSVVGNGVGPAGGPYTLVNTVASWWTKIDCSAGDVMYELYDGGALSLNGTIIANAIADTCFTCWVVLSPGEHTCLDGVACSGDYRILADRLLYLTPPSGVWTSYPSYCFIPNPDQPWQLACQDQSGPAYIPPVWWD
jgi:hypothetical protein